MKIPIEPEEYDFSDVPTNELESCAYYEYMRESKAIVGEVVKIRRQLEGQIKSKKLKVGDSFKWSLAMSKVTDGRGEFYEMSAFTILASTPSFPQFPWQKLSEDRKRLVFGFHDKSILFHNKYHSLKHPLLILDTFLTNPDLGKTTLNKWKSQKTPKFYKMVPKESLESALVSGFFQINTGYTQNQLSACFKDWLMKNHFGNKDTTKERRGRSTYHDPLNALGALRLRYYCSTLAEARELIAPLKLKPRGMSYTDYSAWDKACKKCRCKSLSVNCLSSLRHHPSGVRRSEGERSEPSAAEPRRGDDAPRAKNWSGAGHTGFLLGCYQHIQHQKPNGPPHRS